MKTKVDIRDYGTKPGIDCTAMFQKAEDDMSPLHGIIQLPKDVIYDVTGFYHRNNVTLQGKGDTSIIRNSTPAGKQSGNFCIYLGNFDPTSYGECVHYDVADIKAGTNEVTLKNAASFAIGELVLIDTTDGFTSDKGKFKPYQAFINKVVAINGLVITLEDPISVDVYHAKIAHTNKFTNPKNDPNKIYICDHPVIKNMRFESNGDWAERFGMYKGLIENVSLKTTDVIPGNGFSYCTFKNIRAQFSQKVCELATFSHNSTVDGLVATWFDGYVDDSGMKPLFKMGENMRDCLFTNMTIDSGQGKYFGMAIRFEHAFGNKITNSHFQCEAVAQNGIELTNSKDPASIVEGNEVSNCELIFGNSDTYILVDNNSGGVMKNNKVNYNTISGKVRKKQVSNNSDSSNSVTPNTFL